MKKKLQKPYHRLQFIVSARCMVASSLSNLVDSLAERIHKIKCKYEHDNEKCEEKKMNS